MKPTLPGQYYIRFRNSKSFSLEEIVMHRERLCLHDYETGPCPLDDLPDNFFTEIFTVERYEQIKHIL